MTTENPVPNRLSYKASTFGEVLSRIIRLTATIISPLFQILLRGVAITNSEQFYSEMVQKAMWPHTRETRLFHKLSED